jgi:hypothetical protein
MPYSFLYCTIVSCGQAYEACDYSAPQSLNIICGLL